MIETEVDRSKSVVIYRSGLVHLSVCVGNNIEPDEIESKVNRMSPTGIDHGWKISEEEFSGGQPNPCKCNKYPDRFHYLMVC